MWEFIVQYWIQFLFGLIIAGIGVVYRRLSQKFKKQDVMADALQVLLKIELTTTYTKYMELGYCPIYQKEVIEDTYTKYHALGGNGTGTKMYEELLVLPSEPQTSKQISQN